MKKYYFIDDETSLDYFIQSNLKSESFKMYFWNYETVYISVLVDLLQIIIIKQVIKS